MSDKNIKAINEQKPEETNTKSELNKGHLFEIVNPIKKETTSTFNTSVLMSNKFLSQSSIKECSKNIYDNDIKPNNAPKTTKNLFVVYKESKIKKTGKKRSPYNLVDSDIRKLIIQEALRGRLLKSISEEFKINYSTIKTIWSIYRDELRTERKRGIKKSFTQTINMSNLKIDDIEKENKKSKFLKDYNLIDNESNKSSDSETDDKGKSRIETNEIENNNKNLKSSKINENIITGKILNRKRLNSEVNVRKYLQNNSELSLFTIHSAQNSSSNSKENKSNGKRSNSSNPTCNYSLNDEEDSIFPDKQNKRKKDEQKTCINLNTLNTKNNMIIEQASSDTSKKMSSKEDILLSSGTKNNSSIKDMGVKTQKSANRLTFKNKIYNDFKIFTVKKTNSSNQISNNNRIKSDTENDFLSLNEKIKKNRVKKGKYKEKCKFSPDFINMFETNLSLNDFEISNNINQNKYNAYNSNIPKRLNNLEIENILKHVMNNEKFIEEKIKSNNSDIIQDNFISEFLKKSENFKKVLQNNEDHSEKIVFENKLSTFNDINNKIFNYKKESTFDIMDNQNQIELGDFFSNAFNKGVKLDEINATLKHYENQINNALNSKKSNCNSFSDLSFFDNLNVELESINKNFMSLFNKSQNFDYCTDKEENKQINNNSNLNLNNKYNLDDNIISRKEINLNENFDITDFLTIIEKKYKQFESKVQLKILNKEIEDNTFNNLNRRNQSKLHFLFTFNYFFEFMKVAKIKNENFNEFFILMLSYLELLKNKCCEEEEGEDEE